MLHLSGDLKEVEALAARRYGSSGPGSADFQREADRVLLGRYAPPGVLVNENLDIVQFRGRTSPYLEPAPGEPTTNILKMAREGLFLDLRSALNEAKKSHQAVRRDGAHVRGEGRLREIGLEVLPIQPPGGGADCFLVLFHEATPHEPAPSRAGPIVAAESVEAEVVDDGERALTQLRQELSTTKEYLQSVVEQQDAANEELRSANEEILSSNEELLVASAPAAAGGKGDSGEPGA